ncbi:MAG: trigger factor [Oscillospiraceae bacterium]
MNVKSFEKKEKNTAELTVEVSAEKFEEAVNQAYRKNRNSISVPGFRKGKAPRKIIENMYGASVFYEDAIEILYPQAFEFAVTSEKLSIVGQPGLLDVNISDEKIVTIKYSVALYPEVKMGEYKGITAPKESVRILKKDVDEEIEQIRKRNARIVTADREAATGDTAIIDFEGFLDGKPFEGGKGTDYSLVLGSGQFIPGFEEQVVGMKAGEERDINVSFPEEYTADLAGKPVVFKVKLCEVKESILPELDDEFAKDVSEFDTLEAYRNSIKDNLTERKKSQADKAFEEAVMDKIIEGMACEVPDAMVDERINQTIQSYSYNLSSQGMSFENYLQMMGTNMDDYKASMRPSAEKQIKADIALEQIAKTEDFEVSDEEAEAKYSEFAEKYSMEMDAVKKAINEDAVKQQIKIEKAEKLIYSTAVTEKKKTAKTEKTSGEDAE